MDDGFEPNDPAEEVDPHQRLCQEVKDFISENGGSLPKRSRNPQRSQEDVLARRMIHCSTLLPRTLASSELVCLIESRDRQTPCDQPGDPDERTCRAVQEFVSKNGGVLPKRTSDLRRFPENSLAQCMMRCAKKLPG